MEDYLSEDEQAEALKNWWRENWMWVLSGVVLGLGILGGWQFYQRQQTQRAEGASTLMTQYAAALAGKDTAKSDQLFKQIEGKYGATPYADQARLLQARTQVEAGDFDKAAATLRTVADKTKDEELAKVAKLRLARVLAQQGKYDEALTLLDPAKAGAFAAQVHEIRGDVYFAKNDVVQARASYQAALAAAGRESAGSRELLELKLQDLGDAPATPAIEAPAKKAETPK